MSYEVEMKYPLSDLASMRRACESLAGSACEKRSEVDTYLRHPVRSFAQTDEALRVRQANSHVLVTYKGPKVDSTTKTRTEIELELARGQYTSNQVLDFWERLGFAPVREVRKDRELFRIQWHGQEVHVSLDNVHGLGDFIELEILAQPAKLEESRQILKNLAEHLGLRNSERKSYLELLLEKDAITADKAKNTEDWTE
jgi:adenylate cyclase, class 2